MKTVGDQIGGAFGERRGAGRREGQGLEVAHPALAAAEGHGATARRGAPGGLGEELARQAVRRSQVHVDTGAGQPRRLLVEDADRAQHRRLGRVDGIAVQHLVEAVGDHGDVEPRGLAPGRGEGLLQQHEAESPAAWASSCEGSAAVTPQRWTTFAGTPPSAASAEESP